MSEVLQYRFPGVDPRGDDQRGLAGHALGNLLIAAMTAVEDGDFEDGIRLMNRILAVRGQVVPVSPTPLTLHARLTDGSVVDGQSQVMRTSGHRSRLADARGRPGVRGRPRRPSPRPSSSSSGPGSLYTSLLPSLLIPAIRDAVARAQAPRIFVCNVATQDGRDDRLRPGRPCRGADRPHDADPRRHRARQQPPDARPGPQAVDAPPKAVSLRWPPTSGPSRGSILDDVVDPDDPHHHEPARLAAAIIRAFEGEAGIRRRTAGRTTSRSA